MFNGRKKQTLVKELYEEIQALKDANETLDKNYKYACSVIEKFNSSATDADVFLDFKKMNAFSIERMPKEHRPCTVIGYMIMHGDEQKIKEWYLFCSDRVHDEQVRKFEEYVKSKEN